MRRPGCPVSLAVPIWLNSNRLLWARCPHWDRNKNVGRNLLTNLLTIPFSLAVYYCAASILFAGPKLLLSVNVDNDEGGACVLQYTVRTLQKCLNGWNIEMLSKLR
jgi:hypothetical protein